MPRFFKDETADLIDEQMAAILLRMERVGPDSDEYPRLMAYLERLGEIKGKRRRDPVSKDTLVIAGVGFLQTLVVVLYEQKHVMTSKAFSLIMRPKT